MVSVYRYKKHKINKLNFTKKKKTFQLDKRMVHKYALSNPQQYILFVNKH